MSIPAPDKTHHWLGSRMRCLSHLHWGRQTTKSVRIGSVAWISGSISDSTHLVLSWLWCFWLPPENFRSELQPPWMTPACYLPGCDRRGRPSPSWSTRRVNPMSSRGRAITEPRLLIPPTQRTTWSSSYIRRTIWPGGSVLDSRSLANCEPSWTTAECWKGWLFGHGSSNSYQRQ